MLHDMTHAKISTGLQRLMGDLDQVHWKENFDAIVADDSDDVSRIGYSPEQTAFIYVVNSQIRMESVAEISCVHSMEETFHSLMSFVTDLVSAVGVLPPDLVLLIQLAVLWKVPSCDVPYSSIYNPGLMAVEKVQNISKRYFHFLNERLPVSFAEKLLEALP